MQLSTKKSLFGINDNSKRPVFELGEFVPLGNGKMTIRDNDKDTNLTI